MKKEEMKKWMMLIFTAIIGFWIINNLNVVGNILVDISSVIFPFILGGALAFILNIPMTFFEKKMLKPKKKSKKIKNKKLIRILAIIFAIIVIVLILTLIINLIVPELISIVNLLIENIPYYAEQIAILLEEHSENINLNSIIENKKIDIKSIEKQIINQIPSILTSSISIVGNIFGGIATFFIAVVFAIYILIDKEKLQEQIKKVIYAYLSKEKADKLMNIGTISNNTFKSFFTVQCLEATILGTLCIIGMLILRIPYAIPIGVLIGVTALIPVVGAFIGLGIGAILILSVNPIKVITFVIFVLILQQIEGNVIYPRVVGNSVGLPGMWVLVAVSVGGSLAGILGMLLGVPIASIIYTLLKRDVNKKINNSKAKTGEMENESTY